jgi:ribosomal protein S18 acetylase RimI-like enzyme
VCEKIEDRLTPQRNLADTVQVPRLPILQISLFGTTIMKRGARTLSSFWAFWLLQQAMFSTTTVEGLASTKSTISQFTYRMARSDDLPAIAKLLNDAFEKTDEDTSGGTTAKEIEHKLQQRMTEMKSASLPHAFLVATTATCGDENSVAGFLELGTMPSPISMEKTWNGVQISTRPELPYVANLVVDGSLRRQKVGYTMLQLAMKIGRKWCSSEPSSSSNDSHATEFLFLSVDHDNQGALAFYERLNFERIELSISQESSPDAAGSSKVYLKKNLF